MRTLSKILFCLSLICLIAAYLTDGVPRQGQIIPGATKDPVQTPTSKAKFTTKAGGLAYEITPLFNYEL